MSELIFEIFNKDGKVIKRGEVFDNKLNIDIQEDDYRYVIKNKHDESIIYKEGYIQKSKTEKAQKTFPIIIIKMNENQIELFCNTFKDGHTLLCYQNTEDPSIKGEVSLESAKATLEIESGKYSLYTRSDTEQSPVIHIVIASETKQELLNKARHNMDSFSEFHKAIYEEFENRIEENSSLTLYEIAQQIYLDTPKEDKGLLIAAYDFLYQIEKILNVRRQLNNEREIQKTQLSAAPQELIRVGSEIDKVLIYEIRNNASIYTCTIWTDSNKEQTISLKEDMLHKIELYSKDNLVSVFDIFCPDISIKSNLWSLVTEAIDKTEEVEERRFLIFNNQVKISDEDRKKLSIELYKKPSYETVSAPEALLDDESMEIFIQEFEMLRRLDKPLFLTIKDVRSVFYPNKTVRIPVKDSAVKIHYANSGIDMSNDYFVWIEDGEQNILSSLQFISKDLGKMYAYNDSSRLSHIKAYQDRVISYVSNYFPELHSKLKDEIDQVATIDEVSSNNLYKSLIAKLSKNKDMRLFNNITNLILQDKYANTLVNERFFGGKLAFDKQTGILAFPERFFEYIVQVDSFNVGDQKVKTTYYNIKDNGAIKLEKSDYFIVSAIDKDSYARSGFVFFNTLNIDTVLASWKLGIEVR